jgi:hypothetical protein
VDRLLGWRLASPRLRAWSLVAAWAAAAVIISRRQKALRAESKNLPADQAPGDGRPEPQAGAAQPGPAGAESAGGRP